MERDTLSDSASPKRGKPIDPEALIGDPCLIQVVGLSLP